MRTRWANTVNRASLSKATTPVHLSKATAPAQVNTQANRLKLKPGLTLNLTLKKSSKPGVSARRQRGLTLIELMISVAIGSAFILAAVNFLVSGHQSFRAQNSGSRIQENARFALDILKEHVRMAGYNDTTSSLLDLPALVYRGACGTANINGQTPNPCSDDTTADQGDRLAMALRIPTGATGGAAQDCMGSPLTALNEHVVNVFWVEQDSSSGVSSLYCRGLNPDTNTWHGIAAQPLVDGIEQMQVQYGLVDGNPLSTGNTRSSGSGGRVDRYLNATDLQALDAADATRNYWGDVRSVRIALLVSAGAKQAADDGAGTLDSATRAASYQTFTLLDGAAYTPAEPRIRKVFATTITLNNALADTRRKP